MRLHVSIRDSERSRSSIARRGNGWPGWKLRGEVVGEQTWKDRITILSVNPDAASRDDVAQLASDLMKARSLISYFMGDADEPYEETVKRLDEFSRD